MGAKFNKTLVRDMSYFGHCPENPGRRDLTYVLLTSIYVVRTSHACTYVRTEQVISRGSAYIPYDCLTGTCS